MSQTSKYYKQINKSQQSVRKKCPTKLKQISSVILVLIAIINSESVKAQAPPPCVESQFPKFFGGSTDKTQFSSSDYLNGQLVVTGYTNDLNIKMATLPRIPNAYIIKYDETASDDLLIQWGKFSNACHDFQGAKFSNDAQFIAAHADCTTKSVIVIVKVSDGSLLMSFEYSGNPDNFFGQDYRNLLFQQISGTQYNIYINTLRVVVSSTVNQHGYQTFKLYLDASSPSNVPTVPWQKRSIDNFLQTVPKGLIFAGDSTSALYSLAFFSNQNQLKLYRMDASSGIEQYSYQFANTVSLLLDSKDMTSGLSDQVVLVLSLAQLNVARIVADKATGAKQSFNQYTVSGIQTVYHLSSMLIMNDYQTTLVYLTVNEVFIASIVFSTTNFRNIKVTKIIDTLVPTLGVSVTPSKHYFLLNSVSLTTNILDSSLIPAGYQHGLIYTTLNTVSSCYPDLSSQTLDVSLVSISTLSSKTEVANSINESITYLITINAFIQSLISINQAAITNKAGICTNQKISIQSVQLQTYFNFKWDTITSDSFSAQPFSAKYSCLNPVSLPETSLTFQYSMVDLQGLNTGKISFVPSTITVTKLVGAPINTYSVTIMGVVNQATLSIQEQIFTVAVFYNYLPIFDPNVNQKAEVMQTRQLIIPLPQLYDENNHFVTVESVSYILPDETIVTSLDFMTYNFTAQQINIAPKIDTETGLYLIQFTLSDSYDQNQEYFNVTVINLPSSNMWAPFLISDLPELIVKAGRTLSYTLPQIVDLDGDKFDIKKVSTVFVQNFANYDSKQMKFTFKPQEQDVREASYQIKIVLQDFNEEQPKISIPFKLKIQVLTSKTPKKLRQWIFKIQPHKMNSKKELKIKIQQILFSLQSQKDSQQYIKLLFLLKKLKEMEKHKQKYSLRNILIKSQNKFRTKPYNLLGSHRQIYKFQTTLLFLKTLKFQSNQCSSIPHQSQIHLQQYIDHPFLQISDILQIKVLEEIVNNKSNSVVFLKQNQTHQKLIPPQLTGMRLQVAQMFENTRITLTHNYWYDFLISLFIQLIWISFDDFQFLMINTMISIPVPGLAQLIQQVIVNFIQLDLLMTEIWMPGVIKWINRGKEDLQDTPLNDYFDQNGYESKLFLLNIGSSIIFLIIYALLWILAWTMKFICQQSIMISQWHQKLKSRLMWKWSLMFFNSQYVPFLMASLINLYKVDCYDNVSTISTIASFVFLVALITLVLFIIRTLRNIKHQPKILQSAEFRQDYGFLFEDLNLDPTKQISNIVVYWNGILLLRWIVTLLILIILRDCPYSQLQLLFLFSLLFQVLLLTGKPYTNSRAFLYEFANSIYLYLLLCLTDFNGENTLRDNEGLGLLIVISSVVGFNLLRSIIQMGKWLKNKVAKTKKLKKEQGSVVKKGHIKKQRGNLGVKRKKSNRKMEKQEIEQVSQIEKTAFISMIDNSMIMQDGVFQMQINKYNYENRFEIEKKSPAYVQKYNVNKIKAPIYPYEENRSYNYQNNYKNNQFELDVPIIIPNSQQPQYPNQRVPKTRNQTIIQQLQQQLPLQSRLINVDQYREYQKKRKEIDAKIMKHTPMITEEQFNDFYAYHLD